MFSQIEQMILDHAISLYEINIAKNLPYYARKITMGAITDIRRKALDGSFQVILMSVGEKRIQMIKAIRNHTNFGLKESKDIVDRCEIARWDNSGAPREQPRDVPIPKTFTYEKAASFIQEINTAGGTARMDLA